MVRAAFVLGYLLVGLLVPTDVAQAQGRLTKNWKVAVEYLAELHGVAFCRDAGPLYFIRGGLSRLDYVETEAHERKHIEQYGRFKDCRAFYKWYDTPKGKLNAEAEAFAAGRCAVAPLGVDTLSLRQMHLQNLIRFYVPGTTIYDAYQVYKQYEGCP
jgi:hypothetical protein